MLSDLYQITKCFRDEDLRADRQPEFTQIDLETSFLNEDEIMDITEGMAKQVFQDALGVDLGDFPRMPYSEAMFYYGSDKPDKPGVFMADIFRFERRRFTTNVVRASLSTSSAIIKRGRPL